MRNVRSLRLFVGIEFPQSVTDKILGIRNRLQDDQLFIAQWTRPENLHLTLKFLGEIDPVKVPKMRKDLSLIESDSFTACLDRVGVFSSRRQIRIVWIHVDGCGVTNLQKLVDGALSHEFDPEVRFMSHMTIARLKKVFDRSRLLDKINTFQFETIICRIREFGLIRSELAPQGPTYHEIEKYHLR